MTDYRFTKVLETFATRHSFKELERSIRQANGVDEDDPPPIDRRKLKRLVERDPKVVMSIEEFEALDRWLEPRGQGLAFNSLFVRSNALQAIANAGESLTFLPGSKYSADGRINIDQWDVRAFAKVQREVNRFGPMLNCDIRDVFLHDDLAEARRSVNSGSWTRGCEDDGPCIVSPGSSRATHATELLLSRMLGVRPMTDDQDKSKLPFHFVWPEGMPHNFPSAFRYTPEELARAHPKAAQAVARHGGPALEVGGEVLLDRIRQSSGRETYGVIVVQRRPGGQVWLVLAGITGPATYAAARLVEDLPLDLAAARGESSDVFWTVVRARAKVDRSRRAVEALLLTDHEILRAPQAWPAA